MSETASQLLAAFETLPLNEQHDVLVAMLKRGGELPESIFTGDDLASIADELFQLLDEEESDDSQANSR